MLRSSGTAVASASITSGARWAGWAGWSIYLAVSWTWCIGMFLPVLLLRDFGWGGYLAFLLPNCVGAALMGQVLTRQSSAVLLERHRHAVIAFSLVTSAFQAFFISWLLGTSFGVFVGAVAAAALGLSGVFVPTLIRASRDRAITLCAAAFVASILLVGYSLTFPEQFLLDNTTPRPKFAQDLIWLVPVCVFGFALCPYLDSTFHRALVQSAPKQRAAFRLGFLVFFAALVLLTPLYAHVLFSAQLASTIQIWPVALHLLLQTTLTIWLHHSANAADAESAAPADARGQLPATSGRITPTQLRSAFAIIAGAAVGAGSILLPEYAGLIGPEITYRSFLVFYGLVFPTYVWICIVPFRGSSGATAPRLLITIAAIGLATPFFWLGFIERQTWWLSIGLGVVGLAKALAHRRPEAVNQRP